MVSSQIEKLKEEIKNMSRDATSTEEYKEFLRAKRKLAAEGDERAQACLKTASNLELEALRRKTMERQEAR